MQTSGTPKKPLNDIFNWSSRVSAIYMYSGVIQTTEVKKVIVGQQAAKLIPVDDGLTYWFAVSDKAERVVMQYDNEELDVATNKYRMFKSI